MDPVSPEAVAGLERLLEAKVIDESAVSDVVARLIPYYELKEEYKKWAQALEMLVERMSAADRLGHLRTLVDLHSGPLNDTRAAFLTAIRIFELEPHDSLDPRAAAGHGPRGPGARGPARGRAPGARAASTRAGFAGSCWPTRPRSTRSGRAAGRRPSGSTWRSWPSIRCTSAPTGRSPGCTATPSAGSSCASCWRCARRTCPSPRSGSPCCGRSPRSTRRCWRIAHHAIATLQQITEVDRHDLKAYRALEKHYAAAEGWKELDALLERSSRPWSPPTTPWCSCSGGRSICTSELGTHLARPRPAGGGGVASAPATARRGCCSSRSCRCPSTGSAPPPSSSRSTSRTGTGPSWWACWRPRSSPARGSAASALLGRIAGPRGERALHDPGRRRRDLAARAGHRARLAVGAGRGRAPGGPAAPAAGAHPPLRGAGGQERRQPPGGGGRAADPGGQAAGLAAGRSGGGHQDLAAHPRAGLRPTPTPSGRRPTPWRSSTPRSPSSGASSTSCG